MAGKSVAHEDTLDTLIAAYQAKIGARQVDIDQLQNLVTVCESKISEARKELAQSAKAPLQGASSPCKAWKQLQGRSNAMQQRLNVALADNAKLYAQVHEERLQVCDVNELFSAASSRC